MKTEATKTKKRAAKAVVLDPETIVLTVGEHASPQAGACVMELASYLAHEPWSDHPACVCPVIGAFLRTWNDGLDDTTRQRLRPYAARVLGTVGSEALEQRRAWLVTDWLVREHTAAWLETAKLTDQAAALRALPELTAASVGGAQPAIDAAARASAAARDAVGAAVGDAAWAAARDAAWAAAGAAAGDAAWYAARDAAWAAAGAAACAAAWYAARYAARDAAWAAAGAAAGDAARAAAGSDARAAADAALAPTRARLVEGAFGLLDRMIAATEDA